MIEKSRKELLLEKWGMFSTAKGVSLENFIGSHTIQNKEVKDLIERVASENNGVIASSLLTCLGCDRTSVEVTFLGKIIVH